MYYTLKGFNKNFLFPVYAVLFQSGMFFLFMFWSPSADDPAMFYATAFVWGITAATLDFILLSKYVKNV